MIGESFGQIERGNWQFLRFGGKSLPADEGLILACAALSCVDESGNGLSHIRSWKCDAKFYSVGSTDRHMRMCDFLSLSSSRALVGYFHGRRRLVIADVKALPVNRSIIYYEIKKRD